MKSVPMRVMVSAWMTAGVCGGVAAGAQPLAYEWLPVVRCVPTNRAPVIDGTVGEAEWAGAMRTKPFVVPSGDKATLRTTARLTHDGKNLYLAVECADPDPASLVRDHTRRDGDVYLDDCVEVFLDADLDFRTYYHFLVNAGNVQRDERGALDRLPSYDVSWNAGWSSAVHRGTDGWSVELAIPLAAVGLDLSLDRAIGLNICRDAKRAGEVSCWVPTHGGFHNPHRNATVILSRTPKVPRLTVQVSSVGGLLPGQPHTVVGTATNESEQSLDLVGETRVGSNKELRRWEEPLGSLAPGESGEGELSYRVTGTGQHNLCVLIRAADTGQLLLVKNAWFVVPLVPNRSFGARLPAAPWGTLWWAESTYKIGPDREAAGRSTKAVTVSAAGNEFEAFQLVVRPRQTLRRVMVEATPFHGRGRTLGQNNLRVFQVNFVKVTKPSDAFGRPGLYPDPLVPLIRPVALAADTNAVFWVQVHVPKGTPGGDYRGAVLIHADALPPVVVPVRLHVFGFSLTDETHTRTAYGMAPDWSFLGVRDPRQREQVFEKYLWAFKEHRLSPYNPFAFHPLKYTLVGPRWQIDNGPLKLVIEKSGNRYATVFYRGVKVGDLTNTMTQFEKKGVGWRNTGVGWPGINRLKDVRFGERSPRRCVVEITGEKTTSGPANRKYEITFRFTLPAGRPQFEARMVRFKNTDSVRYQMQGYFYILHAADPAARKAHSAGLPNGYWKLPTGKVLGAVAVGGPADVTLDPIYVRKTVWLEPGQTLTGFGPTMVFFAGDLREKTEAADPATLVDRLRKQGLNALEPVAGRSLVVTEQRDTRVSFAFADFDRAAKKYLDDWKFTGFNFPAMPGSLGGHPRFTPGYNRLHRRVFGPQIAHLRAKGWLPKAYAYWFDEPTEAQYPLVNKGMDLLKRDCPGLTRLLTEQVEDPLIGHVNLWVPVLSNYDAKRCHARQRAGDRVWWYVCCGPRAPYPNNFIDHPALNHRIRFWMQEKYGVTGSLYWATTYWRGKDRVLRNPWETAASISPSGGFWGNGDGILLYPACRKPSKKPCLEGPVLSQRIECLRDGLEDREYFWTLKQLLADCRNLRRRRRLAPLLAEARRALIVPDNLAHSLTEYTKDPQILLAQRRRLAETIEKLQKALAGR